MNITILVVDIHYNNITLEKLQNELRMNPWRLEEIKYNTSDEHLKMNTPLLSAAAFGNVVVCEFLLSLGADIEAQSKAVKLLNLLSEILVFV